MQNEKKWETNLCHNNMIILVPSVIPQHTKPHFYCRNTHLDVTVIAIIVRQHLMSQRLSPNIVSISVISYEIIRWRSKTVELVYKVFRVTANVRGDCGSEAWTANRCLRDQLQNPTHHKLNMRLVGITQNIQLSIQPRHKPMQQCRIWSEKKKPI